MKNSMHGKRYGGWGPNIMYIQEEGEGSCIYKGFPELMCVCVVGCACMR